MSYIFFRASVIQVMLNESHPNYCAYLIRFWRSSGTSVWRVIVQDPYSEQRLRFDSLEGLVVFLEQQLNEREFSLKLTAPASRESMD